MSMYTASNTSYNTIDHTYISTRSVYMLKVRAFGSINAYFFLLLQNKVEMISTVASMHD